MKSMQRPLLKAHRTFFKSVTLSFAAIQMLLSSVFGATDLPPFPEGTRILLVTGIDYPGHPWQQTAPALKVLLEKDTRLNVRIVEDPNALASPGLMEWDAVIIHFMDWKKPGPGPKARENLAKYVASGKGLVMTHFACGAWDNNEWPEFKKLAGRIWDPKLRGHDPHGKFLVEIADPNHPITKGMEPFETIDELYTCLAGDTPIHVVAKATSKVDKKDYPMAFVLNYGQGRVFHTVLGHNALAYTNSPGVGELMRRGCAWAAGQPPVPSQGQDK
jgi:type 1 glutamine amidotransferase